jgi:titin
VTVVPLGLADAPTDLAISVLPLELTLSWAAPVNTGGTAITGFIIYRGPSEGELELLEAMPASATEFVDDDVVVGETYFYAVAVETAAGVGPRCPAVSALAMDVPGAPGDLVATAMDGRVNLTWTAPSDGGSTLTGYVVVRTSGGDTEEFELGTVTAYTDTDVTNGVTYTYKVLAVNGMGRGTPTAEAEATPFKPVFAPGKVTELTATVKKARVTLLWTAPDDDGGSPLTGYVILRGESPDDMVELVQVGLSTSYLDQDVEEGGTYHYTVLAVNDVGQGDPADSVQVKVPKAESDEDEFPTLLMVGIVVVLAAIVLGRVVMPKLKKED